VDRLFYDQSSIQSQTDYLRRFAIEQTVTTNTAAIGGDASLLAQDLK
jgi:delta 1-pyrroline-5-carboxylate dehydrogenase